MKARILVLAAVAASLAACGESPKTSATTESAPVRKACTTPEQAGLKAADLTKRLVELRQRGTISPEDYASLNGMMSNGFRAWAEQQDLKAYCATLDKVTKAAGLD